MNMPLSLAFVTNFIIFHWQYPPTELESQTSSGSVSLASSFFVIPSTNKPTKSSITLIMTLEDGASTSTYVSSQTLLGIVRPML